MSRSAPRIIAVSLLSLFALAPTTRSFGSTADCAKKFGNAHADFERAQSVREHLWGSCPHLNGGQLDAKLDGCKTSLKVLRSFPGHFYKVLDDDAGHAKRFASLQRFRGFINKDSHLENFGVMLDGKEKGIFTFNDVDEWEVGRLYEEPLKNLTSVVLYDSKITYKDFKKLWQAYIDGLSGEKPPKSKAVDKMIKEAEKEGASPPKRKWDKKDEDLEVSKSERMPVSSPVREGIEAQVRKLYGRDVEVRDIEGIKRETGGSGGLPRYLVLLKHDKEFPSGDPYAIVEFKAQAEATGVTKGRKPTPNPERMENALSTMFPDRPRGLFAVAELDGQTYLVRPKHDGNIAVDVGTLSKSELQSVLAREYHDMGSRAAINAGEDREAYLAALRKFDPELLWEEAQRFKTGYDRNFESLRP